ncbi:hypothetical protein EYF80_020883 [Liparis tanakae]|uniref:Uncharacterized protein n=1 Tax=Liparis tanakae TaxID=230148 RepID=A0A4Z2HSW4_9TELE|nr:hypothetical protein EYF80_020883 [Liparis tanakae]
MHIYPADTRPSRPSFHICTSSHSGGSRRHRTRYAELLPESVLASLGTTGDSPRGQKWAKDGNPTPGPKEQRARVSGQRHSLVL